MRGGEHRDDPSEGWGGGNGPRTDAGKCVRADVKGRALFPADRILMKNGRSGNFFRGKGEASRSKAHVRLLVLACSAEAGCCPLPAT